MVHSPGKTCELIHLIQSIIFPGVQEVNALNDDYHPIDPVVEDAAVDDLTQIEEGDYEEQQSNSKRERRAFKT